TRYAFCCKYHINTHCTKYVISRYLFNSMLMRMMRIIGLFYFGPPSIITLEFSFKKLKYPLFLLLKYPKKYFYIDPSQHIALKELFLLVPVHSSLSPETQKICKQILHLNLL